MPLQAISHKIILFNKMNNVKGMHLKKNEATAAAVISNLRISNDGELWKYKAFVVR